MQGIDISDVKCYAKIVCTWISTSKWSFNIFYAMYEVKYYIVNDIYFKSTTVNILLMEHIESN